jgi:hypothetical protein
VTGVTFERFAARVRHEKALLRVIERAFGIERPNAKFRRSLIALMWQFYRISLPAHISDRAAYKTTAAEAAHHGRKYNAAMARLWNANDPAAAELWMWRGARTDSGIPSDLIAILQRQADTLPDGRRDGRPPGTAFAALMGVLAEHHAARAGVPLRNTSIARQLMVGVPPGDVAARHGISIDVIERQFAPYISERDLTVPNWNPEFTATADVAPGFFKAAAALTDLLRRIGPKLRVNFHLPPTDTALAARLRRMGLNTRRR